MDLQPVKEWECSKCPKTFKTKDNLKNHVITHDPDAKVECEICGKISKNQLALSAHIRTIHTERERPSCEICHRVFNKPTKLREHIKTVHGTSERPSFPCTFPGCEKTYLTSGHLSKHGRSEHVQHPVRFLCTICIREFRTRQDLEQHIPTHTTEKPFQCATCGRSFALKAHLKSHEVTHLDKSARDRSKCDACPQTFLRRSDLHRHVRVVHENERNYPCAFCDKRFSSSSHLKFHVEAKHATNKELVHSCNKCEYKSHSKANLARHGKRHDPRNFQW